MADTLPQPYDVADWDVGVNPLWTDVSQLITEDDTPVDNQFSEKQMRLLTRSILTSWDPGFPFVALANVGVYLSLQDKAAGLLLTGEERARVEAKRAQRESPRAQSEAKRADALAA